MLGIEEPLDRLSHILVEMPAVDYLNSRRSALPRAVSIRAGTIAADQFNTWMLLEPGCQGGRFPVWK